MTQAWSKYLEQRYEDLIKLTPGNSGASVTPRKNLTANKLEAFVVKAVAIETPDHTRVVHGK